MAGGDGTATLTGADRVLATLKLLAGHSSGVSLEALSREMGAPKSSTHRALAALHRAAFAEQDERGRYRVGSELVRIAFDYHERRDEVDLVRPVLQTLSDWLSETAHYAHLEGGEGVYALDREESELGVNCIAFALFMGSGRLPSGAISVSAVAMRTDVARLEAVAGRIRSALEKALGPVTRPASEQP
jgi:IclR family transcriptional regulator, acetate operon repressor